MRIHDYVQLWRLGRQRLASEEAYRRLQAFQASLLLEYLREHGVTVGGKRILDLGSGTGGYSEELARHGAEVICLDLIEPAVVPSAHCHPIRADALAIPVCDSSIDIVFCASLIEHVREPIRLLSEIERVLAEGGYCYLSFPPFYSPRGGHEFAPFHYLGESIALRLTRKDAGPQWARERFGAVAAPKSFAETHQGWGLYRMTIGRAKHLLASTKLDLVDLSTRYMPVSFVRWPLLSELLTWHVQFLLAKRSSRSV